CKRRALVVVTWGPLVPRPRRTPPVSSLVRAHPPLRRLCPFRCPGCPCGWFRSSQPLQPTPVRRRTLSWPDTPRCSSLTSTVVSRFGRGGCSKYRAAERGGDRVRDG